MEAGQEKSKQTTSDFDAPRWSLLSFDTCVASGLTYEEAKKLVAEKKDAAGLCIVTDEAARRMNCRPHPNNSTAENIPAPEVFTDIL